MKNPARLIPGPLLGTLAKTWATSPFVRRMFEAKHESYRGRIYPTDPRWKPHFSEAEAHDLAAYILDATKFAWTHSAIKTLGQLIPVLGAEHGGIVPNVEIEELTPNFEADPCVRINAKRKLGYSVMPRVLDVLVEKMADPKRGTFTAVVDEAAHFGYGGLWSRKLADKGLVVLIENTAGRGCEVIPYGGKRPTFGTNPRTWALPTAELLGYHVVGDYATAPISYGTLALMKRLERELPFGCVVDESSELTQDPQRGCFLRHQSHHTSCDSLWIEAQGALIGGGIPVNRCMSQDDAPGGAANWMVTVWKPDYFCIGSDDPIAKAVQNMQSVVESNGAARLPGSQYLESAKKYQTNDQRVVVEHAELRKLGELFEQAEMEFDQEEFEAAT